MAFAADSNYTGMHGCDSGAAHHPGPGPSDGRVPAQEGYSDSSAYVQAAKSTWNEAQKAIAGYQKLAQYSDEDIRILTTTVFHEAGHTTEQLRRQ